ncbi:hypothetical protein BKA65DRAFT_591699 [Rhexocercosporidium sp. MPI-PUGE-AT-0058]|nr:hypothetical protein BKA65DRAFT_591699 [Rhexocercosporidium sp. MPI-PUGE-AT-0058]
MASLNESSLSARFGQLNMQQSSGTSATLSSAVPPRRNRAQPGRSRDDRMLNGVGNLIKKIVVESSETQEEVSEEKVTIKSYESISSYSWKDIEHPTIYVPGLPPKLTPPTLPVQLQKDNLTRRKPRSPAAALDPLFASLLHHHSSFSMSPIQLVTDRNSLRNILAFASAGSGKWRIDVDMINDTMFFSQWDEFMLMMINGNQDSGFGHAFEDCVTTKEPEVEDSMHHERVVRYELGGLKCLVRFEADAYLSGIEDGDDEGGGASLATPPIDLPAPKPSRPVLRPPYKLVHVISRGHSIDPDLIAEIKSCATRMFNINKTIPQLWFSQTRHLCVGYHKDGLVTRQLVMRDMKEELEKWEAENQRQLRNMVRVIGEIREIAKRARKCTVVCMMVDGVKCLRVFERTRGVWLFVLVLWKNAGEFRENIGFSIRSVDVQLGGPVLLIS